MTGFALNDGHDLDVKVNHFEWPLTSKKDRWYRTIAVRWSQKGRVERREVQVTISPKGSSVQVHVDGVRYVAACETLDA